MIRACPLIFFMLISILASGQVPKFSFRNLSINEGLSQSSVMDIAIDSLGFIWMATQDGLNRFDGKEFISFRKNFDDITTPNSNILGKVVNGKKHELWLITSGGRLEKMNLLNQQFKAYNKIGPDSLYLPPVNCLLVSGDDLWIGTQSHGLIVYKTADKKLIPINFQSRPVSLSSNLIQQIFMDSRGSYWILTNSGLSQTDKAISSSKKFLVKERIACSYIDEDKNGTLWLGSFGKGLFVKRRWDSTFTPFKGYPGQATIPGDLVIESICVDNEGKIWVGTYGNGLYIIDPKGSIISNLLLDKRNPFSLSYNDILCIKKDKKGRILIGTDGGGLSYYDKQFNNFGLLSKNTIPQNIAIDQVRSITTDKKGGIWIGTSSEGLTYANKDQTSFQTFKFSVLNGTSIEPKRIVSLLEDEEGDIWTGTQGNGLLIIDGRSKKLKKHFSPSATGNNFLPDHTIWSMVEEKPGKVWIGTRNSGLCLIDKSEGLLFHFNTGNGKEKIKEDNIRALSFIGDSLLCLGFETKGIQFLNVKTNKLSTIYDSILVKSFSEETILRSLLYQHPVLWVGTYGKGLIAINLQTGKSNQLTQENGLPNNTIYGILSDKTGGLWMSTNKGLCRFTAPEKIENTKRSDFIIFTVKDGIQSNEFNTGAYHQSKEGILYFGGVNGLTIFNPYQLAPSEQHAPVIITQAAINNQPYSDDTLISYKKFMDIPFRNNSLSFTFSAPDIIAEGSLSYYYKMEGYEKNWVEAGNRNYTAYTNLPPGDYSFLVKAARDPDDKLASVTGLQIKIRPPFYLTWWFFTLVFFLIAGILYSIYRYRISQLIRLQQVRNRIATDLHDDIGSTLTNISILSELSRKKLGEGTEARVFIDRISQEVSNSNQALDDIVWSINTDNDTLEQTVARMRRYAAEIFDGANINYSLVFDEKFANQKLNMEQRRDFFLIFKEAVNNIYKHAQAKNVRIEVSVIQDNIYISIQDDGKGYNPTKSTHRNGIKNMHHRVQRWKGTIQIDSSENKGTTLKAGFPIS